MYQAGEGTYLENETLGWSGTWDKYFMQSIYVLISVRGE